MEVIFVIGRILFGMVFVMFGINHFKKLEPMTQYATSKKVPSPRLAVIIAGILLLSGGLGVIFGAGVTLALWLLVIFLIPSAIIMHPFWKEIDPQNKMAEMVNFMKNIALAGAALMLLSLATPWALSLF